jgi:inosine/xanthosine triphosphatase
MHIVVGSKNPAKIQAVRQAFTQVWPQTDWEIQSVSVDSGVSNQPMNDVDSITGAVNRAHRALSQHPADYGVGLEGGLQQIGKQWFDCGWVVVVNQAGIEGIGSTARIITPPQMIKLIQTGMELGDVIDQVFGTENAKQKEGHFGLMTNNHITRSRGYQDGVIMALSRFLHPELFL